MAKRRKTPPQTQTGGGDPDRSVVRDALIEVVENQLKDGDPKEVGGTLVRRCFPGYSRDEAMRLIAVALTHDMHEMLSQGRVFDEARYVAKLHALPQLAGETGPGERLH